MEAKVIIVSVVKSNNSENNVWAVSIKGEEQPQGYCKSAYKAMRFAFLLKKQTGVNIDNISLKSLSQSIAEQKAKMAEAAKEKDAEVTKEEAEGQSTDKVQAKQQEPEAQAEQPKPKKQRKPRAKKEESATLIAFQ